MRRNVTDNKSDATGARFADATAGFLRGKGPRNWAAWHGAVTDNLGVIKPKDYLVMTRAGYRMVS